MPLQLTFLFGVGLSCNKKALCFFFVPIRGLGDLKPSKARSPQENAIAGKKKETSTRGARAPLSSCVYDAPPAFVHGIGKKFFHATPRDS